MLIFLAIALLLVLPSPWNVVAFVVLVPVWVLELFAWNRTVKHRRRVLGADNVLGREATVVAPCYPEGQVKLDGEIWGARSEPGAGVGETVTITGRDRLTLLVEPVPEAFTPSA